MIDPLERRITTQISNDILQRNATNIVNLILTVVTAGLMIVAIGLYTWDRLTTLEERTQSLERDQEILRIVCDDVVHNEQTSETIREILIHFGTARQAKALRDYYSGPRASCPKELIK